MDLRPSPKFLGNGQIIPQAILLALCGHRYRLETLGTDFYLMFWVVPILGRPATPPTFGMNRN
jgi:hypothetical protein